jgi:hypothetical protein
MDSSNTQSSERDSSKTPPEEHREALQIQQGNQALRLRVDDAEKGGHANLKLAKDGHVSYTTTIPGFSAS